MLEITAALAVSALVVIVLLTCRRDWVSAIAGSLVVAAVVLIPTFYVSETGTKNGVLAVASVAALLVLLRRRFDASRRRGSWLVAAYVALAAAATVLHPQTAQMTELVTAALPGASLLVIWLASLPSERIFLIRLIVGVSTLEAIYALLEMVGLAPRLWENPVIYPHQLLPGLTRGEGTMGHPLMLALLLLLAVALVLSQQAKFTRPQKTASFILLSAGLFATGSRSGIIVAVALLLFSLGGSRATRVVVGSFSALLLTLFLAATGFFSGNIVTSFLEGDSVGHRSGALEAVPKLITQQPANVIIGNGVGSVDNLFTQGLLQTGNFFAIDNQLVTTLATTGILGLVTLVVTVVVALCQRDAIRKPLIAVTIFFFTFDVLSWPAGFSLYALALGLCFTQQDHKSSEQPMGGTKPINALRSSVQADSLPKKRAAMRRPRALLS
ncbi:hypothetical protein J2X55_002118 [Microbacterium sp. 1154]|uniref:O-antigen ligase family protein n=1 Tax=Microbacterium sp. 1154 TaxID=2817733 RepID=UPI0028651B64|nr:O-antigen ligase family protein [Microbacterium sp. 1154]MDR6691206.1 hypothetical protein [Microbacterium sp. 1154]